MESRRSKAPGDAVVLRDNVPDKAYPRNERTSWPIEAGAYPGNYWLGLLIKDE